MSKRLLSGIAGVSVIALGALAILAWERTKPEQPIATDAEVREATPSARAKAGMDESLAADQAARFPDDQMPTVLKARDIHSRTSGENWREAFCDEHNWSGLGFRISSNSDAEFLVDAKEWARTMSSTRVGLASWMSECRGGGQPIRILDALEGTILAEYHASSGLRSANR